MSRTVAFFDFDGTLTRRDSLLPFLRYIVGSPQFFLRMLALSPVLGGYAAKVVKNDIAKEIVLGRFLAGLEIEELHRLGGKFARDKLPELVRSTGIERLRWHQSQKHMCVLVSASLDLYLKPWARDMGFDDFITSTLEVDGAGRVLGSLSGGNCFGAEKVKRIQTWLSGKQVSMSYAYGDSAGDLPMLKLANQGYLLQSGEFRLINDSGSSAVRGAWHQSLW